MALCWFMKFQKGFTLVELVGVILILGILSISATGLFSSKQDVETNVLKNQLISSLRLTQQLALSRQDLTPTNAVNLAISQTSDSWLFTVWEMDSSAPGAVAFEESSVDRDVTSLRFSTNVSTACSALSNSTSYTIQFDGDGNLLSSNQLKICIVGTETIQICVSSLGFAYEGNTCL